MILLKEMDSPKYAHKYCKKQNVAISHGLGDIPSYILEYSLFHTLYYTSLYSRIQVTGSSSVLYYTILHYTAGYRSQGLALFYYIAILPLLLLLLMLRVWLLGEDWASASNLRDGDPLLYSWDDLERGGVGVLMSHRIGM